MVTAQPEPVTTLGNPSQVCDGLPNFMSSGNAACDGLGWSTATRHTRHKTRLKRPGSTTHRDKRGAGRSPGASGTRAGGTRAAQPTTGRGQRVIRGSIIGLPRAWPWSITRTVPSPRARSCTPGFPRPVQGQPHPCPPVQISTQDDQRVRFAIEVAGSHGSPECFLFCMHVFPVAIDGSHGPGRGTGHRQWRSAAPGPLLARPVRRAETSLPPRDIRQNDRHPPSRCRVDATPRK